MELELDNSSVAASQQPAAGDQNLGRERSSSADRRRRRRNGELATQAQRRAGGSRGSRGSWAWSSDATSLAILQRSFTLFDKNGDGAISASELKSVLSNLGEDIQDSMVEAMIDLGDTNNCGVVSYDDFVKLMTGRPLSQKSDAARKPQSELKELFNSLDSDGSGYLDRNEVHDLCQILGSGVKKRHLDRVMRDMVPGKVGTLSEDGGQEHSGVSFDMFQRWWEDRNRQLNELLVLPEGMVFSIREDAKARKLLPTASTPEDMWHRLAVLLRLLADRQSIWGDPRQLYGQKELATAEESSAATGTAGLRDKLSAVARQKDDAARFKRCFLRPNSVARQVWDGSQVFLLLYVFISVPYRTCFMIPTPAPPDWAFWVELFVDVYFVTDILLNFRTAYYDGKTGELVIGDRQICWHYIRSWFAIDFVSCLPISYIELLSDSEVSVDGEETSASQLKALKILRMLRMAKMLRIFRLKKILQRYREQLEPLLDYLRIFVLMLAIFLCAHVVGCMWYYFGTMTEEDVHGNTVASGWIHHEEAFQTQQCGTACGFPGSDEYNATCTAECFDLQSVPYWDAYIASLYWAITTVSTVGYGDIIAWTEYERLFSFFSTLLGVMVFGMVSGALSSILMTQKGAVLQYHQRMDEIRQFLRAKNVPTSTRRQVMAFYNNLWSEQAVYDEADIIGNLPSSLNNELLTFLYHDMIQSVALFYNMDAEVIQNICQKLQHTVVLRDMFVFQEGQIGKEMYIIETGEVEALVRSKKLCSHTSNETCEHCIHLGRQGPKSFFGELAVMGVGQWQRRKRSVRAVHDVVHLSCLTKSSIDLLRADYPQLNHALFQVASTVRCEGVDSITNIGANMEPATKQDILDLERKMNHLHKLMERALLKLDPHGETVPSPGSASLSETDSANLYTPGGSTDWSKVRAVRLNEASGEEEDITTLGDPRGSGAGRTAAVALSPATRPPPQSPRP